MNNMVRWQNTEEPGFMPSWGRGKAEEEGRRKGEKVTFWRVHQRVVVIAILGGLDEACGWKRAMRTIPSIG